jgi:hypothetical protein
VDDTAGAWFASQDGAVDIEVLTWRELVKRLGSRRLADAALVTGDWWRVLRDAYVEWFHDDSPAVRAAALRKVLADDVALSGRAALWALGVGVLSAAGVLDVTVPRGRHLERRPGVVPHIADLPDSELCEVNGLLVVSAARAVVDVARRESMTEAVAFGDAVLRSGAATLEQIDASLVLAAGLRNVRVARAVVPHLEPRSESLMESRLRMKLVLGGLPRPEAQFDMYDERGGHAGRGDLHLKGVVVEYDGREERLKKSKFNADRRRRSRISELGLEIREFTSTDVYTRTDVSVCAEVLRAVELAKGRDRSRLRSGPDTLRRPRLRPLPTRADVPNSVAA